MTKYPGWRTMTGAQRRNAKYDAIWEAAKGEKTRFNAASRDPAPSAIAVRLEECRMKTDHRFPDCQEEAAYRAGVRAFYADKPLASCPYQHVFNARYIRETKGKARDHWNAWCEYVAPDYGMTGEAVSALHLAICKTEAVSLEDTF